MDNQTLQKEFMQGTVPNKLEGFYKGKIEEIYPTGAAESFIATINNIWTPWQGKCFYLNGRGDNILSPILMWATRIRFGDFFNNESTDGRFHAFPFQTTISSSIFDEKPVLQLAYNLPQNPKAISGIIDEIVWVGDKAYLGKMYVKSTDSYALKAWFRLFSN